MPRFDFLCTDCESTFEHLLPAGSATTPPCLQCGGGNVRKLLATPPVIFKGGGFFKTDSAKRVTGKAVEPKEAAKKDSAEPSKEQKNKDMKADKGK
ncbi:MAG: zinc ribbon domain-containing protein [Patescibacteria group bacterium]